MPGDTLLLWLSPHQDTPQLISGEIGLTQVPSLKIENPRSPISDGASDNNGWMYFQSPAGAVSAD